MNITAKISNVTATNLKVTITMTRPTVEFDNSNISVPIYNNWEIPAHEIFFQFTDESYLQNVSYSCNTSCKWGWNTVNGYTLNGAATTATSTTITATVSYLCVGNHTNGLKITVPLYMSGPSFGTNVIPNYFNISVDIPVKTYTVTYNGNGGTPSVTKQTKEHYDGIDPMATATRTGYTFIGWSTSSSATNVTYPIGSVYFSDSDATLYAVWQANTYTVTYDSQGGTTVSSTTETYNNKYGTMPTTTKTGYVFNGWYTSETGGTRITSTSTMTTARNHTLYAQWTVKQLQVYFYKNCTENETPYTETYTYGINNQYFGMNLKTNTGDFGEWFQSGYTLRGWATTKLSTDMEKAQTNYDIKATVEDSLINSLCGNSATGTLTLYAVWYEHYLLIHFHSNGADNVILDKKHGDLINQPVLNKDVILSDGKAYYATNYSTGTRNFVGTNVDMLITHSRYSPASFEIDGNLKEGWWGIDRKGTSNKIYQDTAYTGQQLAVALGKDLTKSKAEIDLYPLWEGFDELLYGEVKIDGKWVSCVIQVKHNNEWKNCVINKI